MIQILLFYRLLLSTNKDCIWRPVLWVILSLSMKCKGWSFAVIDLHDGLEDLIRPVAEKEVSTISLKLIFLAFSSAFWIIITLAIHQTWWLKILMSWILTILELLVLINLLQKLWIRLADSQRKNERYLK